MNSKRILVLGIALVLFTLAAGSAFAQSAPKEGYYTCSDNGYQVLIRQLGDGYWYVQYFGPNGGKILTSGEGKLNQYGRLDFADNAGGKCHVQFITNIRFKCYVTGGEFKWNRNP